MILFFFAGLAVSAGCSGMSSLYLVVKQASGFICDFFCLIGRSYNFFKRRRQLGGWILCQGRENFFLVRCLNYIRRYVIFFYPSVFYPSEPCSGTAKPLYCYSRCLTQMKGNKK